MRTLWVTREGMGEEYDRRMLRIMGERHEISQFVVSRVPRRRQMIDAALRLCVPETFAFAGPEEVQRLVNEQQAKKAEIMVFSHEHLDRYARQVKTALGAAAPPFVSIRHNVTSDGMRSIIGGPLGDIYCARARMQEKGALGGDLFAALAVVSRREQTYLAELTGRSLDSVLLTHPGAPPPTPLAPDATMQRELVLSGTYNWFPKTRDLKRFVAEKDELVVPLFADSPDIRDMPSAKTLDYGQMRFGLITDRFVAGHKLKTSAYLMQNCIVLTYSDVYEDFSFNPQAARRFIRPISHARDIGPIVDDFMAEPQAPLRAALAAFKTEIAAAFSWTENAEKLEAAFAQITAGALRR
jgi:hypothetical protein